MPGIWREGGAAHGRLGAGSAGAARTNIQGSQVHCQAVHSILSQCPRDQADLAGLTCGWGDGRRPHWNLYPNLWNL